MYYSPVNNPSQKIPLYNVVRNGVADDGSLFMPQDFPVLPEAFFHNISGLSLVEIAYVVLNMMFGEEIDSETLKEVAQNALSDIEIPFVEVEKDRYVLDLTKGPTGSYHDISARLFAEFVKRYHTPGHDTNVLVIANSNAANAVADAFSGLDYARIYAVYPRDSFSYLRRGALLARENVVPVEVAGNYRLCRRIAIETLLDPDVMAKTVTITANSENLAILLPRVIYFFYAYARLTGLSRRTDNVVVEFPTEHLGNLSAAVIAFRMGLPKSRLRPQLGGDVAEVADIIMPRMVGMLNGSITAETLLASAQAPVGEDEAVVRLLTESEPEKVWLPRDASRKILRIGVSSAPLIRKILNNK